EAAGLRIAPAIETGRARCGAAIAERVAGVCRAQPFGDMGVDVPDEAVLGCLGRVAANRAVAWVVRGKRVGPVERRVAHGIERLERGDGDRLCGDADPGVALSDNLVVMDGPADVEIEQVRRVEHLDNDAAGECAERLRTADEDACGVRDVRGADDGAGRWPVIDVGGAGDEELFLYVTLRIEILGPHRPGRAAEGVALWRLRERPRYACERRWLLWGWSGNTGSGGDQNGCNQHLESHR